MVNVNLGQESKEHNDESIKVYDTIEIAGVPNPEDLSSTIADTIVAALDAKYGEIEAYASEAEFINFNVHAQTIDVSLEFKGVEISEPDLIEIIRNAIDGMEDSLIPNTES
jgi:hypothetical protein